MCTYVHERIFISVELFISIWCMGFIMAGNWQLSFFGRFLGTDGATLYYKALIHINYSVNSGVIYLFRALSCLISFPVDYWPPGGNARLPLNSHCVMNWFLIPDRVNAEIAEAHKQTTVRQHTSVLFVLGDFCMWMISKSKSMQGTSEWRGRERWGGGHKDCVW